MAYIAKEDLEHAIGVNTVLAIFDDDGDGVVDTAPLAACLDYASTEVDSFLRPELGDAGVPVAGPPAELKYAAVDFAVAYAMRRRPDIVRAMGEQSWTVFRDSAIDKVKRFASGQQGLAGEQGNERTFVHPLDEDLPRMFDDMGLFNK